MSTKQTPASKSLQRGIVDELHKPARKRYQTRCVQILGLNDLWQADLIDMTQYARFNRGNKFILTVINTFSKYAWTIPIKKKSGSIIAKAFKKILTERGIEPPKHLQTDQGTEFYNPQVRAVLNRYNINLYSTHSPLKASIVERFNRTIKNWIWKEFTANRNKRWLQVLPDLTRKYNTKIHRTIKFAPADVNKNIEKQVAENIAKECSKTAERFSTSSRSKKFKVGDIVRISKVKTLLEKGYTPNWTSELFTINTVKSTFPTTYTLKDRTGKLLVGTFYAEELQKTSYPDVYLIERVIQRRGGKSLVKWLGFPSSENSWIDNKVLVNV